MGITVNAIFDPTALVYFLLCSGTESLIYMASAERCANSTDRGGHILFIGYEISNYK